MMRDEARVADSLRMIRQSRDVSRAGKHSADTSRVAGLMGSALADRFRAWKGQSGRRYVFSVYPLGTASLEDEIPRYDEAVVIAAARLDDGSLRIVDIAETSLFPDLIFSGGRFTRAAADGATEVHMHLLASTRAERQALIEDLRLP